MFRSRSEERLRVSCSEQNERVAQENSQEISGKGETVAAASKRTL